MNSADTLVSFVRNQQNIIKHMYTAQFEKFKIMDCAFCFIYTYDLACQSVDQYLIFYCVAFLLAGV